jgi:hypothetical protein
MSKVVDFRNRVIESLKNLNVFAEVDWYDGVFDEQDISDWSLRSPAAFVSVQRSSEPEVDSSGQVNPCLRCVVAIITQDRAVPRQADAEIWGLIEAVVAHVTHNYFGDPNVGPGHNPFFQRLVDPELRREGVAVGIVEWKQSIRLGTDHFDRRDAVMNGGTRVTAVPDNVTAHTTVTLNGEMNILTNSPDQVTFTEEERIFLEDNG